MVIMIDLMLDFFNVSMRHECPRSTQRCMRLVLAQCIRYLRCCVIYTINI
uniref:Uncharacterized protein n=1 Tax=Hyaloperonospora parasitica TaxID=123356 RepID=A2T2K0_9STRA|nr:unknown [Hyaloperonospora parasitica]